MRRWTPAQLATASGAELLRSDPAPSQGPERVVIDSREAGAGALFVGLAGRHTDGSRYAAAALEAGAWGVVSSPERAHEALSAGRGVVLQSGDPLSALQRLARSWRRELGASVIGITGSTGKTTTKDILRAILAPHRRVSASRANYNTEIGLPLEILAAPEDTQALVLEMGMRGPGQIAELAGIAEPDVAVIVSIGPVHLELLGSVEAIAAAKAELIAGLQPGGTAVVPAGERLLEPHLRHDVKTVTFGKAGEVRLVRAQPARDGLTHLTIDARGARVELEVPFPQTHLHINVLAAVAAARAVGVAPGGRISAALSPGRGQRAALPGGITLIDDSYNANPMSMRAALEDLAATAQLGEARRAVAVLGDMLELGPGEREFHAAVGRHAAQRGIQLLVTVGPRAAAMIEGFPREAHRTADAEEAATLLPGLLRSGDVVLVKASRGLGLERVAESIAGALRGGGAGGRSG